LIIKVLPATAVPVDVPAGDTTLITRGPEAALAAIETPTVTLVPSDAATGDDVNVIPSPGSATTALASNKLLPRTVNENTVPGLPVDGLSNIT